MVCACNSHNLDPGKSYFAKVKDGCWTVHPPGKKFEIRGIARRNRYGPWLDSRHELRDGSAGSLVMSYDWPENILGKSVVLTVYIEKSDFAALPKGHVFAYHNPDAVHDLRKTYLLRVLEYKEDRSE